jgi:hypothetical protein
MRTLFGLGLVRGNGLQLVHGLRRTLQKRLASFHIMF